MNVITADVTAWLPSHSSLSPENLGTPDQRMVAQLAYTNPDLDMASHGYTRVGTAQIVVSLIGHDELVANKVESLRAEKKSIQAECAARALHLDSQIQNLLAITYIPQAADLACVAGDNGVDENPPAATIHDQFGDDCPACDGTGEGQYDGATCSTCKGKGTL